VTKEVRFPDETIVRASALPDRLANEEWREFGLYADERWGPSWPHEIICWEDFGVPDDLEKAARQICRAFALARGGAHVEIGCAGGIGRTGTILACMAVLAGVPKAKAVEWVRENYNPYAVETDEQGRPVQERWVERFADHVRGCTTADP
jgi:protein-tyrosine phosphatase